jgi:hypothetical protein
LGLLVLNGDRIVLNGDTISLGGPDATGALKAWSGSAWVPVKYWDGSAWVSARFWTGSAWVPDGAAPAIEYVGGKTWTTTGTSGTTSVSLTDLTGGLASAPAAGDFVIVAYNVSAQLDPDRDVQVTSGYTEVADIFGDSFMQANLGVFYKFMPGTPDTTVTMGETFGAGVYGGAAVIQVWRGVNATTPMDVAATTAVDTGTSNPNPPSITPVTAGAVIIAAGGGALNTSGSWSHTSSDLSNFRTDYIDSITVASIGMGSYAWTSGAFNPAEWAGGEIINNNAWAAVTMALRPA